MSSASEKSVSFVIPHTNAKIKRVLRRLTDRAHALGAHSEFVHGKMTFTGSDEALDSLLVVAEEWKRNGEYDNLLALMAEEEERRRTRSPKQRKPAKPLTTGEQLRLHTYERELEPHLASFMRAGRILWMIQREKLYRGNGHRTFEQYCQERWGISREHAYRLIKSAASAQFMLPIGPQKPPNERIAREFNRLRSDLIGPVYAAASDCRTGAVARDYRTATQAVLKLNEPTVEEAVEAVKVALTVRAESPEEIEHRYLRRQQLDAKHLSDAMRTLTAAKPPEVVRAWMTDDELCKAAYLALCVRHWLDEFLQSLITEPGQLPGELLEEIRRGLG